MSLEATIMIECRIIDAPKTPASSLRTGQPVLFGGKVQHITEAVAYDGTNGGSVEVTLAHYDEQGMVTVTKIIVSNAFEFDCLQILPMRQMKDVASP